MTLIRIAAAVACLASVVQAEPRRIVSTAPGVTEMLFALGAGDRVIGVTSFCDYPEAARKLSKIGSYTQPNLEAILALRPDLVVIQKNPIRLGDRLRSLRLKVLELDYSRIAGIYASIGSLGAAIGSERQASELNRSIYNRLEQIRERAASLPKKRVLFVVGRTPGKVEALIAVGGGSYLDELLSLAGGENIFRDSQISYPRVSMEEIIARKPEVLIDMGDMSQPGDVTEVQKRAVVELWNKYNVLPAVRSGRIHAVAAGELVVPGPRVTAAALHFVRLIHPEAGF